ncbi:DUF2141 domain-containing protein [Sphingobium boeckii]|nr:DUF2141 domain-containing protein [Sphingobium boeckii]
MLGGGAAPGALDIQFANLRSQKGLIRICLTAYPKNFPGCTDDRNAITRSVHASDGRTHITGLPSGDYALALIHDENSNAKLDTFAGIPKEGIGFSRNPTLGFGPPKFAAAQFGMSTGTVTQSVKMKYFL